MGAEISNCQFTKLGDACYSPFSMINNTLSEAAANNYVLNLERSKFKSEDNQYWFSCMDGSVPYNGTINCEINDHATIICGSSKLYNSS
ncbi:unnamed protein product [Cryptosporidium hominis]|uniref:Uncharacterized protein n=1 Tax=Cryptosporidium hominis TaxID=237895 RepID=A0A0S4TFE8_CRYHO|nr:hypothetical protein [Cryptosporidium hominis TU502]PPS93120.1 Uncharacterized protein GY17_00003228 [Cryptosporidium hominis]CUV05381.1 unnamed protein product [Cryptosporidium hominis]|eukprot:PPS93120.1 Uncharacterized protein GY17_00003228 [Cryptosporidium hominis]